ncbi:hypothetical protein [Bombella apis]|uniref:hypothetical protein n=1 Tax=Bombella apis TaxID=1785988 RepID=UPI0024A8D1B4|nr:hypothetical protein [Bombella apis]
MAKKKSNLMELPKRLADKIKPKMKLEGKFQHDIAADLGVNQGRISEFLNGKRDRLMVRKMPSW